MFVLLPRHCPETLMAGEGSRLFRSLCDGPQDGRKAVASVWRGRVVWVWAGLTEFVSLPQRCLAGAVTPICFLSWRERRLFAPACLSSGLSQGSGLSTPARVSSDASAP